MAEPLLKTKLYMPPARPEWVSRPRLTGRLNADLWQTGGFARKLTLISAPAGFGKTMLVVEWLKELEASGSTCGLAWLSLDEDDNDPARFLTYLIAALETVAPGAGAAARALLQSPQSPSLKPALTLLINDVAALPTTVVLVLDDYHAIEQPSVHDAVAFLIEHLPPCMHLVIATRVDPPLPLARLRSRSQMVEVRAGDLRFTSTEAATFLNQVMHLGLDAAEIAALGARTEGWISGLQLAALSMRGREAQHVTDFIADFSGSNRHVIDYLAEEVLAQQPQDVRDFMCQTAILDRMSAPLCDAVTGRDDSDAILRQLEQENLFLVPLDDHREWYRYHRLFADFLRSTLQQSMPGQVRDLHCWAADWMEHNGLVSEAVGHVVEAGEFEWAARLVEQMAYDVLVRGEVTRVLAWLEALPEASIRARPRLAMAYTWALLVAGDWDGAEVRLREAEGSVRPESADPDVVGQIYAARAYVMVYQGDVDRAAELANQAVELLSGDEPFLYGIAMFVLGMTHYFSEGVVAADRAFSRAVDLAQDSGGTLVSMLSIYATGFLKLMQGYLGQARDLFQRGLRLVDADRRRVAAGGRDVPSPGLALMYQGLGEVMREQNKLDEAERYLTQCIERAEAWGNAEVLVDSYVFLARLGMSRGDFDAAHRTIERAVQLVREGQVSPLTSRQVMAHRARLYVAERNLAPAVRWAASLERSVPPAEDVGRITSYVRGVEQLALARLLVAQRDYPRALDLLATLLDATEAFQWVWHTIEVLALQAVVHYSLGETEQALRVLERALRLAEPEGYVRIFVEAGAPMADLLRRAAARGITPAYAAQLLAAFRPEGALPQELAPRPVVAESPLVEPLSSREIEVLQLVVDGLSNREIAERLVIAVSTVKTHINHIYRKLDVATRTQAVARARVLDLA